MFIILDMFICRLILFQMYVHYFNKNNMGRIKFTIKKEMKKTHENKREYTVMLCECVYSFKLYSMTSSIIMMSKSINYSGTIVGYLFVLYFVV